MRILYRKHPSDLLIEKQVGNNQSKKTVTACPRQQVQIITNHFTNVFNKQDEPEIPRAKPVKMKTPFSEEEVQIAIKSMKNNKSAGIDDVTSELIKYGPLNEISKRIAYLLNHVAEHGDTPEEIHKGILVPFQKPGKPKGSCANLRPIILLSVIRKILSICMIRRTTEKLETIIPLSQAAYQGGRSTTEHVFALKMLIEKAINSQDYNIFVTLFDMSKAFDTMRRPQLIKDLGKTLDDDELHMFYILLYKMQYTVQVGNARGEPFETNIGAPQGDCASAPEITFTLAVALMLQNPDAITLTDRPRVNHNQNKENFSIDLQYADDIGNITTDKKHKDTIKQELPLKVKQRNLNINNEKTEEFCVGTDGNVEWKAIKYLGSILDTEKDIKRRKGLSIDAFYKYERILCNRQTSIKLKIRTLNTFIYPMLLYNCEIWTLTKKLEESLDIFQRKLLRRMLNIKLMDKIRNEEIYKRSHQTTITTEIKKRRLNWLGHMLRLPEITPAKLAFREHLKKVKGNRGRQKQTWIRQMNKDLKPINKTVDELTENDYERKEWKKTVARLIS